MKKNIVMLMVFMLGVLLIGCGIPQEVQNELNQLRAEKEVWQKDRTEQNDLVAKQKDLLAEQGIKLTGLELKIEGLEGELGVLADNLTAKEAQIAELTEENADLEVWMEELRQPTPKYSKGEIAGTITREQTIEIAIEWFWSQRIAYEISSWTKGPYSLLSLETLKDFLLKDPISNFVSVSPRRSRFDVQYNGSSQYAFQLKDHWIRAGFSPWSLGLAVVETDTEHGKMRIWRNIFLTKENGEFVFYLVEAHTDQIIKLEKGDSNTNTRYVLIDVLISDK